MKTHRLARVAEAIREVASETILFELKDPRVKRVTVTHAEVSGDLQHAKVYVSVMGTEKEQQLTMHGLRSATGFVQSKLAARLQTRFTPQLTFVLDEGVKKSIEVTRLINEALGQPAQQEEEAAAAPPEKTQAGEEDAHPQAQTQHQEPTDGPAAHTERAQARTEKEEG